MSDRIRPKLTYANVMVTILAVIVLGGSGAFAVAAGGNKAIKKVVRRLAPSLSVGHASSADSASNASHATNSDLLGGSAASSFFPSAKVTRANNDVTLPFAPSASNLFVLNPAGPLTMSVTCQRTASDLIITPKASSSVAGGSIGWGVNTSSAGTALTDSIPLDATPSSTFTQMTTTDESGAGEFVYQDQNTTIAIPFPYFVSLTTGKCQFYGVALQA